jgi:D-alanyl-D-alanine dipeptidase
MRMTDSPFRTLIALAAALILMPAFADAQQQRPASFVDAATVVPGLVTEVRYHGSNNFIGKPIDGYEKPICYLTRQAAAALADVARDFERSGLAIKAFDCYRPARAVAHFVRWAQDVRDIAQKSEFYPNVDKRNLFRDGYIASRSGHSRGSTIDLTLVRRDGDAELDMGTPYDFLGPRSWTSDKSVSNQVQANRKLLANAMRRHGFVGYSKEWWHFTLRAEPFPNTYFDFPVR